MTIWLVWRLLRNRPRGFVRRDRRHGQGVREIRCAILEVDGVLVGFMSKSEPARHLEDCLDRLIDAGCAVIVCATRSYGGSVEVVGNLRERGWRIRRIVKDRNPAEDQDRAEEIVAEILSAVERAALVEA